MSIVPFASALSAWKRRGRGLLIVLLFLAGVARAAAHESYCAPREFSFVRVGYPNGEEWKPDFPPSPDTAIEGDDAQSSDSGTTCTKACSCCVECLDSMWIINTRCLPSVGCCGSAPFQPQVRRWDCREGCKASTWEDLFASDGPDWCTVIYIHGNWTAHDEAVQISTHLMRRLPKQVCSGKPVRLIVWSWPSDLDYGRIRDNTAAAGARAATESYYLGRFMTRLNDQQRVLLVGYSFGARVSTGALHLLAGCSLGGRHLVDAYAEGSDLKHPRTRGVLLAAAIDVDWLIPGHWHGCALEPFERLAITVNPRDIVLRTYSIAERRHSPEAVGKVGPPINALGPDGEKVYATNVTRELGNKHGSKHYLTSPLITSLIRGELQSFDDSELLVAPGITESPRRPLNRQHLAQRPTRPIPAESSQPGKR